VLLAASASLSSLIVCLSAVRKAGSAREAGQQSGGTGNGLGRQPR